MTRALGRHRDTSPRTAALAMAVLAASQLIIAIDYNIVYVALPSIGSDLDFSESSLQWVVSAYALTFGGFLLLGGRAADLLDRRSVLVTALGLYAVSSLAGGLAQDQALLIVARMVQGLGGALLFPATLAILNGMFAEGPARTRALAVWGTAGAAGGALGSLLGGLLTSGLGWRSTFFVTVPVALLVAATALAVLPGRAGSGPDQRPARGWRDYDLPGSVTVTAAALLLVFALVTGPESGWTSSGTLTAAGVSAACLGAFVLVESRARTPLVPLSVLRNRSLSAAAAITALHFAGFGGQFFLVTTWLQDVDGMSPLLAGLAFTPLALAIVVGTTVGGRLVDRAGARTTAVLGLVVGGVGLVLLGVSVGEDAGYASHVLPGALASGLGMGITWTAQWVAASSGVRTEEQGIASGIASTTQQLGGAVGLAVLVAVSSAFADDGARTPATVSSGLTYGFLAAAAFVLVGALVAAVGLPRSDRPAPQPAPADGEVTATA